VVVVVVVVVAVVPGSLLALALMLEGLVRGFGGLMPSDFIMVREGGGEKVRLAPISMSVVRDGIGM